MVCESAVYKLKLTTIFQFQVEDSIEVYRGIQQIFFFMVVEINCGGGERAHMRATKREIVEYFHVVTWIHDILYIHTLTYIMYVKDDAIYILNTIRDYIIALLEYTLTF